MENEESHQTESQQDPEIHLDQLGVVDELRGMKLQNEEASDSKRGGDLNGSFGQSLLVASPNDQRRRPNIVPAATEQDSGLPSFIKIEKNLASLGFFTPSSRRIKEQKVKRISFVRDVDGKRVEVTGEILPSALYGLPITADQDKYLALQEIITNTLESEGEVRNPIKFRSSELLRLLGRNTKTGKNYKDIREWFDVMLSTTIKSNGIVEVSGRKVYGSDGFHVFDRVVSVGTELEDGSIADANYVWLSTWQLENINNKNLLPIDFVTYLGLKNRIAKALVPLLQIWLFATQKTGSFEKRYDDLCEFLTIQKYSSLSEIRRQLEPSLVELAHHEYLEYSRIEKTADRKAFKIVFIHGRKFRRDRRRRADQKTQAEASLVVAQFGPGPEKEGEQAEPDNGSHAQSDVMGESARPIGIAVYSPRLKPGEPSNSVEAGLSNLVDELTNRGVIHSVATNLVGSVPTNERENIRDYIEYWDSAADVGPGFLYELIRNSNPLPPTFIPRRVREARDREAEREAQARLIDDLLKRRYDELCRAAVDRYLSEFSPAEFERRVAERTQELVKHTDPMSQHEWDSPAANARLARTVVRNEVSKETPVPSFDDFSLQERPRILVELDLESAA